MEKQIAEICSLVKLWQTSEALELIWGSSISKDEAQEIFLFLYDYTNSFKNSNTTKEIFLLAWKTLEFWIDHDKLIVEKIKKSLWQMKMCSKLIDGIKMYNSEDIVWTFASKEVLNEYANENCILDSFMKNLLLTITGDKICFILIEKGDWFKILIDSKNREEEVWHLLEKLLADSDWNIIWKSFKEIEDIIIW